MRLRDLVADASLSLFTRGVRAFFTMAGVILGLGSLVAIAGVAGSMGENVVRSFDRYSATQVMLSATGATASGVSDDDLARLRRVGGVEGVAFLCVFGQQNIANPRGGESISIQVAGISAGGLDVLAPHLDAGRTFDGVTRLRQAPVALASTGLVQRLSLAPIASGSGVLVGGRSVSLIGSIDDAPRLPLLLNEVVVPLETGRALWGPNCSTVDIVMTTAPERAQSVGAVARQTLAPNRVDDWTVAVPPSPDALRHGVIANLDVLYAVVAGLSLIVGILSIGNTMSLSVLERRGEIGLRRSIGFSNGAVFALFSVEAFVLGFLGGLVGSGLGNLAVITVATLNHWPVVTSVPLTLSAPLLGGGIGLLGGLPAAISAARISPASALRS